MKSIATFFILLITTICFSQQTVFCGQLAKLSGTINIIEEKDVVFNTSQKNYYLILNFPITMLTLSDEIECDTASSITKVILFTSQSDTLIKYNNKLVIVTGIITLTPTAHYNSRVMIEDISDITIENSKQSIPALFYLGDKLIAGDNFELLGISSSTGVKSYKYAKQIPDYMFGRKIDNVIVGLKDNVIVTTIYNLIPTPNDTDVPKSIIELIQKNLPFPLGVSNGVYGIVIDNNTISISRTKNELTFNKDRIMFLSSIKHSSLIK